MFKARCLIASICICIENPCFFGKQIHFCELLLIRCYANKSKDDGYERDFWRIIWHMLLVLRAMFGLAKELVEDE